MSIHLQKKICQYCGKEYYHWNGKSKYCEGPHYTTCVVCGKKFEFDISKGKVPRCCSKECTTELRKATCRKIYGTDIPSKSKEVREKLSESTIKSLNRRKKTCLQRYGVENAVQNDDVRRKISDTLKSPESQKKMISTMRERYGVDYAMQNSDIQKKHARVMKSKASDGTVFDSSDEKDVYEFFLKVSDDVKRQIPVQYEYDGKTHVSYIDFCVEGILFEVKGAHLLNGVYDYRGVPIERKLQLYREKHVVVITNSSCSNMFGKPNSTESNGLKYLNKCPYPLIGVDVDLFKNPSFPYKEDRPSSFYDVRVAGQKSSYEAFHDISIRWKMIVNRILYSGGFIDGSQVLTALNVTRTCKQPSWFSKSFAKSIISNYTSTNVIVDPFAGWGTRYDASVELGKLYIGCDLNEDLVKWHISRGRDIECNDAKNFKYDGVCSVFICPPYQDIEQYFQGQDSSLTQCQWLQIVMTNVPNAAEYVMVCKVVDPGWEKYVVDVKQNKSHFGVNNEYVLYVPGTDCVSYRLSSDDIKKLKQQEDKLKKYRAVVKKTKSSTGSWVWMCNKLTNETRCVPSDVEEDLKSYGWVRGRLNFSMSNYVWITKGNEEKRVPSENVELSKQEGWRIGRIPHQTYGYKHVYKGSERRKVPEEEARRLVLQEGWSYGINRAPSKNSRSNKASALKGTVHIHNDKTGERKMIPKDKLDEYIKMGWSKGRGSFTGSTLWVHNDELKENKRVSPEDLPSYISAGWIKGQGRYN